MGNVEVFLHDFRGCFWGVDFSSDSASFWGSKKGDFGGQKQEKSVPFLGVHDRNVEIRVFWGYFGVDFSSDSASFWGVKKGDFWPKKGQKMPKTRVFCQKRGHFCRFLGVSSSSEGKSDFPSDSASFWGQKRVIFPVFRVPKSRFPKCRSLRHGIVTFWGVRGSIFVTFGGVKKVDFWSFLGVWESIFGQKRVIFENPTWIFGEGVSKSGHFGSFLRVFEGFWSKSGILVIF